MELTSNISLIKAKILAPLSNDFNDYNSLKNENPIEKIFIKIIIIIEIFNISGIE